MIMNEDEVKRDILGRVLPGSKLRKPETYSCAGLRTMCLEILNEKVDDGSGDTLVQSVLRTVAVAKPEAFLAFVSRLLPKEISQSITKVSPIVLSLGQPDQQEGIVIEQQVKKTVVE
jgi:hypothetical protein